MKTLPRAIRDLQNDLWVPAELANLLQAVLVEVKPHVDDSVMCELVRLLDLDVTRTVPTARQQLGLASCAVGDVVARNLTRV